MKIPKIVNKDGHVYVFFKKCNDKLFLYKDAKSGLSTCFDLHDLGLIRPVIVTPKSLAHHNKF